MTTSDVSGAAQAAGWRAAGDSHHAYFTGIVLAAVARLGTPVAAELVYRVFCRQREARVLPGLAKLGLVGLPHAVAAAQYHYLSEGMGAMRVAAIEAWSGLWEGALASHGHRMVLRVEVGDTSVAWTVSCGH